MDGSVQELLNFVLHSNAFGKRLKKSNPLLRLITTLSSFLHSITGGVVLEPLKLNARKIRTIEDMNNTILARCLYLRNIRDIIIFFKLIVE